MFSHVLMLVTKTATAAAPVAPNLYRNAFTCRFHHIKSLTKRKHILEWGKELRLAGYSKPGYPGKPPFCCFATNLAATIISTAVLAVYMAVESSVAAAGEVCCTLPDGQLTSMHCVTHIVFEL